MRILRAIQHRNIVKIHQFFYDDRDFDYVVLEHMPGDLFDHIAAKVRSVVKCVVLQTCFFLVK